MHIQSEFVTIKKEDVQQALKIIVEANRDTFPHIIHKVQSIESFTQQTREIIEVCLASQQKCRTILNNAIEFIYGLKINGKLIAIVLSLDIVNFYTYSKIRSTKSQFYSQFQHLDIQSMKIGTAAYFTRLGVLPEMTGKKLGKKLIYQSSKYLLQNGYKYSVMGSVVPISYHMFINLGGVLVRHEEAVRPEFTYQINIIKNDFQKLISIYDKGK